MLEGGRDVGALETDNILPQVSTENFNKSYLLGLIVKGVQKLAGEKIRSLQ